MNCGIFIQCMLIYLNYWYKYVAFMPRAKKIHLFDESKKQSCSFYNVHFHYFACKFATVSLINKFHQNVPLFYCKFSAVKLCFCLEFSITLVHFHCFTYYMYIMRLTCNGNFGARLKRVKAHALRAQKCSQVGWLKSACEMWRLLKGQDNTELAGSTKLPLATMQTGWRHLYHNYGIISALSWLSPTG